MFENTMETNFGEIFVHDVDSPVFFLLHENDHKYTLKGEISLSHQTYTKKIEDKIENLTKVDIVHFDIDKAKIVEGDLSQDEIEELDGEVDIETPSVLVSNPKLSGFERKTPAFLGRCVKLFSPKVLNDVKNY